MIIGKLYSYPISRVLWNDENNSQDVISKEETYLLLNIKEINPVQKRIKVLTSKGLIGWIEVFESLIIPVE